jgi:hypothetical protein
MLVHSGKHSDAVTIKTRSAVLACKPLTMTCWGASLMAKPCSSCCLGRGLGYHLQQPPVHQSSAVGASSYEAASSQSTDGRTLAYLRRQRPPSVGDRSVRQCPWGGAGRRGRLCIGAAGPAGGMGASGSAGIGRKVSGWDGEPAETVSRVWQLNIVSTPFTTWYYPAHRVPFSLCNCV